jgi:hypothetical protein
MNFPNYLVSIFNPGMKTFEKFGVKLNGIRRDQAPERALQWYHFWGTVVRRRPDFGVIWS